MGASCIWAESSTVYINKCIVQDQKSEVWGNSRSNSFCVASDNSIITINQSDFIGNDGSVVIASFDNKYLKIENCSFQDNDTQVMEINYSDATIINNKFINNGMAINLRGKASIIGNLIAHSKVFCDCSNFFGTAINMNCHHQQWQIIPLLKTNRIHEEQQSITYYTSAPAVVNNLFWKNENFNSDNANLAGYNGVDGEYDDPVLRNNLVKGDPLFRFNDTLDFELSRLSPCINKGSRDTTGLGLGERDLAGNIRIDPYHRIVDIGAYEYSS